MTRTAPTDAGPDTAILDRSGPDGVPATASAPFTGRQYVRRLRQRPADPDEVARAALDQVARNRAIIVVPRSAGLLWYLQRLSPGLVGRINRSLAAGLARDLVHHR